MFGYYLQNATRSMRRNPALTTLVVMAIAMGIGVSITMTTVFTIMSGNPIPERSDELFAVQLDSWNPLRPFDSDRPERAPHQLTWKDANALLEAGAADRQVGMFEAQLIVQPEGEAGLPFEVSARVTSSDFFPMFQPPFQYGSGWSRIQESNAAQVIVLTQAINDRLFGGENSVGRELVINERRFTVVGVLETWEPTPRFYDVINSGLSDVNEVFIPLSLTPVMEIRSAGSDWGWKSEPIRTFGDWLNSESVWLQYWAELPAESDQSAYLAHLDAYVTEQKKLGRFERPLNNQIHDVMDWMAYHEVVARDVRVLVGLGYLFLVVCLISSISILLTKFEGRAGEISLRRALGASRSQIISQNLLEVGLIGALGGVTGLALTAAFLSGFKSMITRAPDALFRLDATMVIVAIGIAILTSLVAGIYPAMKTCAVAPAQNLKTQ